MQRSGKPRSIRTVWLILAFFCAVALFFATWRAYYKTAYPIGFEALVHEESERNALPPSLVFAIIRTESSFRPEAQSSVGARGLMQLTEETFDWVAWRTGKTGDHFADLYEPGRNIEYGTALLRLLLDEFGSVENALCAYHAGWGNAKSWLADPKHAPDGQNIAHIPFGDTGRYVEKVLATRKIYQSFYELD